MLGPPIMGPPVFANETSTMAPGRFGAVHVVRPLRLLVV
jgi:hypothetical protein